MRKLTAIMCAILIFSTAIIPGNAEVAVYSESGQTVSDVGIDNIGTDNIESDSIETDNTETDNIEFAEEPEDAVEFDGAGEPVVLAETSVTVGDFTISGDDLSGNDYSYADGVLTILSSAPITISGMTNTDRIVVDSSSGANITLSGVDINTRAKSAPAFEITEDSASVTVILDGNNTLTSGTGGSGPAGYAGLQNNCVPVTITGSGNLTATGGEYGGAGIGGSRGGNGENITIGKSETTDVEFSGTITAKGSGLNASGAGIGGGSGGNGTNIKISGSGTVTAKIDGNGYGGAGIGGGDSGGNGTNITISMSEGGKVEATGDYNGGAGIGGGKGGDGTSITINGSGSVEATGGSGGAGIGGGRDGGSGTDIKISGSVIVKATGSDGGAGIGGGNGYGYVSHNYSTGENTEYNYNAGNGKNIIIDENFSGKVTAEGGYGGAGIGGGGGYAYYSYDTGKGYTINGGNGENINITISGGTVTATGGVDGNNYGGGAGIGGGGGYRHSRWESNGTIYYKASAGNGENINITISGGTVEATGGGSGGAGIGGGSYYDYDDYTTNGGNGEHINIIINGGTVTAKGSPYGGGAGIGGGSGGGIGNDINISGSGGTVTATGGSSGGAGIGGGSGGAGGADEDGKGIKISGDVTVKATGGDNGGAGIGGGKNGDGSNITIDCKTIDSEDTTGDEKYYKIIATGGRGGAGIGGGGDLNGSGAGGNGSNINIYGGNIKARADGGSNCGAGIGGGRAGNGSNITITAGKVFAEGGGGAGIGGGSGSSGIGGAGTDIKIKGGVITATGGSVGGGAGIGGGEKGEADNIQISGGKIIATAWVGAGIGIGGSLDSESDNRRIQISGNAYVEAESSSNAAIGGKDSTVEIKGGNVVVTATAKATAALTRDSIGIGGKDSTVEIKGGNVTVTSTAKATSTATATGDGIGIGGENSAVIINGGTVTATATVTATSTATATGKSIGIGGENSSVKINGTSSKSFPWVFTNKIVRGNVSDKYSSCIVFEEAYKDSFNDEVFGNEYAPDGVVYGDVDLSDLTEAYTLESDKLLRVQDGTEENVTFKTAKKLILKGTLYIAESATPDKYYNVVIEDGRILHEDESNYVEENSGEWICDICGKEEPHNWEDWQKNRTHHWHKCTGVNDCSVNENPIEKCSITDFSTVSESEYGEHIFRKLDNTRSIIVTYECEVCKYRYSTVIPEISIYKVDEGGDPLIGAKFGLYSDEDCTQQVGDEVTAAEVWVNGEKKAAAVFNAEIEFDKSYYIKETKAPDGYKKSDTVYTVKVIVVSDESDEPIDGKVTYSIVDPEGNVKVSDDIPECVNTRIIPDPIQVYKVCGGEALAGAKFKLYSDAGCAETAQVGKEVTADKTIIGDETKAVASFTADIEVGRTYYIKETKAPDGYRASDEVYRAVVDADGKVTYSIVDSEGDVITDLDGIPECVNTKIIPAPIQVYKVGGGKALAGAKFKLYSDAGCAETAQVGEEVTAAETTIDDETKAVASFTAGIEVGKTYYIRETEAPSGYWASDEVYRAVVDADGKVTYSIVDSKGIVIKELDGIPECVNTKIIPDPIQVYKVGGGKALAGAKFKLYSDAGCAETAQVGEEVTAAETTIDDETKAVASFTAGIEVGKTYYIRETEAPDGYRASDEVYKAVVDADGKVTYSIVDSKGDVITDLDGIPECVNTKIIPAPIQVYKVGGGKALAGAKFKLYSDAGCAETAQVGAEVTAAEKIIDDETKAVASFTAGIEVGKTYYIKETKAPDGYRASDEVYRAVVDADGKVTYSIVDSQGDVITALKGIPECVNTKIIPDPVQITKVDGESKALAGAEFGLYSDRDCKNPVGGNITATSDKNGKVSFTEGIEPGKTYYIMETKAPEGYMVSEEVFKAVVGADGKVKYGDAGSETIPVCKNSRIIPDPAKIIVEDGETGDPLAGAEFAIYSDEQCAEANRIAAGTTAIDADSASDTHNKAIASFTAGIEPGKTYYIKETAAPDGYTASEEVFKAVVGADGKVTYGVAGSETTSKAVPVCKNYKIIPDPAKIVVEDGNTGAPLAGAKFGIYSDAQCTEESRIAAGTAKIDNDSAYDTYNKAVVSFETQRNKTYYIKETKAPDGYKISDKVFQAVVGADGKVTYGAAGSETTSKAVPVCKNYRIIPAPANIIKEEGETGAPYAVSPKTGDTGEFGTAGMAILSGIICAASFVGGVRKRKRKI